MYLRSLSLIDFKNRPEAHLEFSEGANCFVGNNGSGKTNMLDAIYYLSLCKSYFNPIDTQNIHHGKDFFVIQGNIENDEGENHLYCGLKKGQRKIFRRNKKEYDKLSDHIGLFPVVIISPTDSNLIWEGSEERRKFIDSIISQFNKTYLENLIAYNKLVSHRNVLLKLFFKTRKFDKDSLDVWTDQMIPLAEYIFEERRKFIADFIPYFSKYYKFISNNHEEVSIEYLTDLSQGNFSERMTENLDRDRQAQFTTAGVHKDDLIFKLDNYPVKRFASQGQQKSFLIALKLAQFDFVCKIKKLKPIILLDDILDKLDDLRITRLMELISNENFGQIFITDTSATHIASVFEKINVPLRIFNVNSQVVLPVLSETE